MTRSSQEQETDQHGPRKISKVTVNLKKCADERNGSTIIRGREIKPVDMLLNLDKKPLECYFEGLKEKPSRRRKIREPKKKCLNFWDSNSSSASHSEGWVSTVAGAPMKEKGQNEMENRLLGGMIQAKMKTYEKLKEHNQNKISMKQRLAEESYLEQQENLAETWLGIIKRRSQLRNVNSEDFLWSPTEPPLGPTIKTPSSKHCTRIEISLLSKKFWKDDKKEAPLQKKVEPSVVDNLDEVFGEKLVFVDEEDQ